MVRSCSGTTLINEIRRFYLNIAFVHFWLPLVRWRLAHTGTERRTFERRSRKERCSATSQVPKWHGVRWLNESHSTIWNTKIQIVVKHIRPASQSRILNWNVLCQQRFAVKRSFPEHLWRGKTIHCKADKCNAHYNFAGLLVLFTVNHFLF